MSEYLLCDINWRIVEPISLAKNGNRHPSRCMVPLVMSDIVYENDIMLILPVNKRKHVTRCINIHKNSSDGITLSHLLKCICDYYTLYILSPEDIAEFRTMAIPDMYDFTHECNVLNRLNNGDIVHWSDCMGNYIAFNGLEINKETNIAHLLVDTFIQYQ